MATALRLVGIPESDHILAAVHAQPDPETWQVTQTPDGLWTFILRFWNPGDVARCDLCPLGSCIAVDNLFCSITASGRVSKDEARLFDSRGMKRVKGG